MKYEKPDLEELELLLEGSFLATRSKNEGVDVDPDNPGDGEEWD